MDAKVTWKGNMSFDGTANSNYVVPLGTSSEFGGDDDGFRPLELLLMGLAGCTSMDVMSILVKKKQDITAFEVRVHAERAETHPKIFTKIVLEYIVEGHSVEKEAVERAVDLSANKYCSAEAMLRKAVDIESIITILEAQ